MDAAGWSIVSHGLAPGSRRRYEKAVHYDPTNFRAAFNLGLLLRSYPGGREDGLNAAKWLIRAVQLDSQQHQGGGDMRVGDLVPVISSLLAVHGRVEDALFHLNNLQVILVVFRMSGVHTVLLKVQVEVFPRIELPVGVDCWDARHS